jgi:hypothetical protein
MFSATTITAVAIPNQLPNLKYDKIIPKPISTKNVIEMAE